MKPCVVDSSVAIKWFVAENHQAEAMAIAQEWIAGQLECIVPDWFFVEVENILWKKPRKQLITQYDVTQTLQEIDKLPFRVVASRPLSDRAVSFAIRHDRTVYDSLYIVLAEEENCTFVTADDRLANAVAPHFPNVIKLSDWEPTQPTTPPPATPPTP
ncbi:MAG: type II toxin-antitoxin system VapC family toxin [Planctomycetota bacterium]